MSEGSGTPAGSSSGTDGAKQPTVAWFHCFSGIAGDMALGALIDAGADLGEVRNLCARLPIGGWALEAETVMRTGIAGTKIHVLAERSTVVRTAAHITALVEEARLPERVRRRALATFNALAVAEGRLHRRPPDHVHFHEVGGIDAIIDIVGTCAALEVLEVDEVYSSPVATGMGMIRSAHGLIPNPPPAVVELLKGAPTYSLDVSVELTTPTGAALLAALAVDFGPMPELVIDAVGFGAGSAELQDRPNLTQVIIGERAVTLERGQVVTLLECNVDDITGELLAHAITALLEAGALDAWVTPIVMKKGRPGYTVSALSDPSVAGQVASTMVAETGTFGVRGSELERWPQSRLVERVDVAGLPIRIKIGARRLKVEHDDAVRVARRTGMPLREVLAEAEQAWRRRGEEPLAEVPYIHGPEHAHDHDYAKTGRTAPDSRGRTSDITGSDATVHAVSDEISSHDDDNQPDEAG
ncbi:MAG: nickel pincer cofactor biosynthesis protein LarC [Acidimicrobiales bacterium]|nr:nickel pincer cofactor biosynthesis protein LarC [Acidimicrobiales bacterium]